VPAWRAVTVVHPFPSALDAAVTAVVAVLAGAPALGAATLGAAMLLLQFAIGAVNDWADAPGDTRSRRSKPIVAGLVPRAGALAIGGVCAALGLLLAATQGAAVVVVGAAGLGAGFAYDLGLKGTAGAWLVFAAGFILLPLFAWLGGAGAPPAFLSWIVVLALPAGALVSLANGLVDLEADEPVGSRGPAVLLGRRRTIVALAALDTILIAGVVISVAPRSPHLANAAGIAAGALILAAGWNRGRALSRRARLDGWHLQAIGLAVLAAAWFAAMAA
jgi:4-hydroxybenzoate polyprenyltransferase